MFDDGHGADGGGGAAGNLTGEGGACGTGQNLEGCTCAPAGQTRQCFVGDPSKAGVGLCTWGHQTCETHGEFSRWGPCTGYGADDSCKSTPPTNDGGASNGNDSGSDGGTVDAAGADAARTDSGGTDAAATDAATEDAAPDAAYCNAGGSVYVNNLAYGGSPPYMCSGIIGTPYCGPTFGQGGIFSARCAGTYTVCARVVSSVGCSINDPSQQCVTVNVPADGATVGLPAFPGFGPLFNGCLYATCPNGQPFGVISTSVDVVGTTLTGLTVNHPNVAAGINPAMCGGGGNGGSGGGSF